MLHAMSATRDKVTILNLGTDEYCEVNDSIGWITSRLGLSPKLEYAGGTRGWPGDNPFIFLDTRRIRALGWRPKLTIREGVDRTKWLIPIVGFRATRELGVDASCGSAWSVSGTSDASRRHVWQAGDTTSSPSIQIPIALLICATVSRPCLNRVLPSSFGRGWRAGDCGSQRARDALDGAELVWITFDTPVDDNDCLGRRWWSSRLAGSCHTSPTTPCADLRPASGGQQPGIWRETAAAAGKRTVTFGYSPENLRLGQAIDVFTVPIAVVAGIRGRCRKTCGARSSRSQKIWFGWASNPPR